MEGLAGYFECGEKEGRGHRFCQCECESVWPRFASVTRVWEKQRYFGWGDKVFLMQTQGTLSHVYALLMWSTVQRYIQDRKKKDEFGINHPIPDTSNFEQLRG